MWRAETGDRGTDFFNYSWWNRLFNDIDFFQRYIDRWQELRSTFFSEENINATLDAHASQIEAAMVRDNERWGYGYRNSAVTPLDGTWQGEVEHQRAWLERRPIWVRPTISCSKPTAANITKIRAVE